MSKFIEDTSFLKELPKDERPVKNEEMCRAKHDTGYMCTRAKGHTGDHVAFGLDRCVGRWAQNNSPKPATRKAATSKRHGAPHKRASRRSARA